MVDRFGDFGFGRMFHGKVEVLPQAGKIASHLGRCDDGRNGDPLVTVDITVDVSEIQQERGEAQRKARVCMRPPRCGRWKRTKVSPARQHGNKY